MQFTVVYLLLLFHSTESNGKKSGEGPEFREEPEDVYELKKTKASISCIAENCFRAWFTCNAGWYLLFKDHIR